MRPQGFDKWVVNMSNRNITKSQEEVLSLGLNFSPAPRKLPLLDTISSIEAVARTLDQDDASDLRGRVHVWDHEECENSER